MTTASVSAVKSVVPPPKRRLHSGLKPNHYATDMVKQEGSVLLCLLVGCLTSRQYTSVSQGRTCSDNFTCCHTEIEIADQTFYHTQSRYTDTGPTSPSADPVMSGAWQGSHLSANFEVTGMTRPEKKKNRCKRDSNPVSSAPEADP